ncbi:unnamed protein product, partial [Pocillopora meandrina]
VESARSEPDIGKRQMFPLSSQNTVRGWQSPTHSPKLATNFRAEFNPSGSEGDLDHSPCVSADDIGTNKQESVLEIHERYKWRRAIVAVSVASLITSIFFSAAAFYGTATTDSSSALATALDTLFAVFSAAVVIWRFRDYSKEKVIGPRRERYGSVAFGIAFTFNGLVTIIVSSFNLEDEKRTRHANLLWPALLGFSITYCLLATLEFWISKRYQSSVLVSLCIDDAVTSGLLLGIAISTLLVDQYTYVWYLDHIVAIVLAVVLLASGVKILLDIFVRKELPFQVLG